MGKILTKKPSDIWQRTDYGTSPKNCSMTANTKNRTKFQENAYTALNSRQQWQNADWMKVQSSHVGWRWPEKTLCRKSAKPLRQVCHTSNQWNPCHCHSAHEPMDQPSPQRVIASVQRKQDRPPRTTGVALYLAERQPGNSMKNSALPYRPGVEEPARKPRHTYTPSLMGISTSGISTSGDNPGAAHIASVRGGELRRTARKSLARHFIVPTGLRENTQRHTAFWGLRNLRPSTTPPV